ncbi:MAG: HAD family hydrolase [Syntrophales bacterium]|jgi:phosphoglycolate phosphatase|nr:HAD family hydrolase [Syntrophales bacterium]
MRIENIIFDLDGTLVDSLPGIEYASRCAVDSICPQRALFELRPFIGPPISDIFRRIFPDIEGNELQTLVKEFRKAYDNGGWQKTVLFDGIKDTLIKLENLNICNYLVTSKPKLPTENILDLLNIREYFVDVVSPDSATPAFPSKSDAMAHLIARHTLDLEKTLYVGDSQEDKAASKTCGIRFAAVSYGYGHFEEDSTFIDFKMSTISDLLKIVRKENL